MVPSNEQRPPPLTKGSTAPRATATAVAAAPSPPSRLRSLKPPRGGVVTCPCPCRRGRQHVARRATVAAGHRAGRGSSGHRRCRGGGPRSSRRSKPPRGGPSRSPKSRRGGPVAKAAAARRRSRGPPRVAAPAVVAAAARRARSSPIETAARRSVAVAKVAPRATVASGRRAAAGRGRRAGHRRGSSGHRRRAGGGRGRRNGRRGRAGHGRHAAGRATPNGHRRAITVAEDHAAGRRPCPCPCRRGRRRRRRPCGGPPSGPRCAASPRALALGLARLPPPPPPGSWRRRRRRRRRCPRRPAFALEAASRVEGVLLRALLHLLSRWRCFSATPCSSSASTFFAASAFSWMRRASSSSASRAASSASSRAFSAAGAPSPCAAPPCASPAPRAMRRRRRRAPLRAAITRSVKADRGAHPAEAFLLGQIVRAPLLHLLQRHLVGLPLHLVGGRLLLEAAPPRAARARGVAARHRLEALLELGALVEDECLLLSLRSSCRSLVAACPPTCRRRACHRPSSWRPSCPCAARRSARRLALSPPPLPAAAALLRALGLVGDARLLVLLRLEFHRLARRASCPPPTRGVPPPCAAR